MPPRESAGDALVAPGVDSIWDLPNAACVGTGSIRRRAQLLAARPDLHVSEIRGNVDTRLRKLQQGEFAALILAEAGLRRLNLEQHITQVLPKTLMLPAIGQGALGLETRGDDRSTAQLVRTLDDPDTHCAVMAERSLLARLRGGCRAPVGAWGRVEDQQLSLDAVVLSPDGRQRITARGDGPREEAIQLGEQVADELLAQGADQLLEISRQS